MLEPVQAPSSSSQVDIAAFLNDGKLNTALANMKEYLEDCCLAQPENKNHSASFFIHLSDFHSRLIELYKQKDLKLNPDHIGFFLQQAFKGSKVNEKGLALITSVRHAAESTTEKFLQQKAEQLTQKAQDNPDDLRHYLTLLTDEITEKKHAIELILRSFAEQLYPDQIPQKPEAHALEQARHAINKSLEASRLVQDVFTFAEYQPSIRRNGRLQQLIENLSTQLKHFSLDNSDWKDLLSILDNISEIIIAVDIKEADNEDKLAGLNSLRDLIKRGILPGLNLDHHSEVHLAAISHAFDKICAMVTDPEHLRDSKRHYMRLFDEYANTDLVPRNCRAKFEHQHYAAVLNAESYLNYNALINCIEFCASPEFYVRFKETTQEFEAKPKAESAEAPSQQVAHRKSQAQQICKDYLYNNRRLQHWVTALGKVAENELTTIKYPRLKSFAHLQAFALPHSESNRPQMKQRPDIERASWRHQLSRVKYTLTDEELTLLSKGMGARKIPTLYLKQKDATHKRPTYQAVIHELDVAIGNINDIKAARLWPFSLWPFPRTAHLEAAKSYLEYYQEKHLQTKNPEIRLGVNSEESGKHRSLFTRNKGRNGFRARFERMTNSLSSLFSENRALKKLQSVLENKHHEAKKLKISHAPYFYDRDKNERNRRVAENIAANGMFFTQTNLKPFTSNLPRSLFVGGVTLKSAKQLYTRMCSRNTFAELPAVMKGLQEEISARLANVEPAADLEESANKLRLKEQTFEAISDVLTTIESSLQNIPKDSSKPGDIAKLLQLQAEIKQAGQYYRTFHQENMRFDLNHLMIAAYLEVKKAADFASSLIKEGLPHLDYRDEQSLNFLGGFLSSAKQAKKDLEQSISCYARALQAHQDARSETIGVLKELLASLSEDQGPFDKNALLSRLSNEVSKKMEEDVLPSNFGKIGARDYKEFTSMLITCLGKKEVIYKLECLHQLISQDHNVNQNPTEAYKQCIEKFMTEVINDGDEQELRNEQYSSLRMLKDATNHLETIQRHVEAITYHADHFTAVFNGSR